MTQTTHFGFREVPESDKARLVRGVFDVVAPRYDLMNDVLSGGMHRLWKAAMVDWLRPREGLRLLDMAARAHALLKCRGASRSDFRWDDEHGLAGIFLLEVNTQPGMTPLSLVPEQGPRRSVGLTLFPECIVEVEQRFGGRAFLMNDANAGVLAE